MFKRLKKGIKMNYVDFIPLINEENTWDFDNSNKIIIKI